MEEEEEVERTATGMDCNSEVEEQVQVCDDQVFYRNTDTTDRITT